MNLKKKPYDGVMIKCNDINVYFFVKIKKIKLAYFFLFTCQRGIRFILILYYYTSCIIQQNNKLFVWLFKYFKFKYVFK